MQAALVGRNLDPTVLAQDESFWAQIRQQFAISPNLINLNNAGVSPHPRVVGEAVTPLHATNQRSSGLLHVAGTGKAALYYPG
jgi:hypothetical protein